MQHIDVLGICISMCMLQDGWRAFVHISVGFGIACSVQKAIPEPQIAEQQ